ncbi:MAG: cytochrome P450 [Steroidobacteraceae bacterium]
MTSQSIAVPSHVPPGRVIDFDYFQVPGANIDPHAAWKKLHDGPDIVYTPRNGGHWIATRGDDIFAVMQDVEHFSSNPFSIPARPADAPRTVPLEVDPPELQDMRSIVLRMLSPKALFPLEPDIRALVIQLLEELRPRGRCEFVADFGVRMPVELFLRFVELPSEDRGRVRGWVEDVARNPDAAAQVAAQVATHAYLSKVLEQRRRSPGKDLFSSIVAAEAEGKIKPDDSVGMALNILFGGIETVTSGLSFIVRFLADHPEHRRELRENPKLMRDAIEEFMRRFGILNLGRTAASDFEFRGVQIKKGDRMLLPIHLYGLDERKFERPMEVDFHREHFRHIAFGAGPHRCLGSNLARPELRIFLEEWLPRFPEFSIAPGETPKGHSGSAMAITYLPLVWPT